MDIGPPNRIGTGIAVVATSHFLVVTMVAEQDRNKHAPELLSSLRNATKRFNAAREEVQRVITANPDAPLTENELVEIAAA